MFYVLLIIFKFELNWSLNLNVSYEITYLGNTVYHTFCY